MVVVGVVVVGLPRGAICLFAADGTGVVRGREGAVVEDRSGGER